MEQKVALNAGVPRALRPQVERGNVIHRQAEHQVGVEELALVMGFFSVAQAGEGCPCRGARGSKRVRAVTVRHPVVPIESGTAPLFKGRHNLAELGMDGAAVIALVVVLDDDFPVGINIVSNGVTHSEVCKRVTL